MCGIAGFINQENPNIDLAKKSLIHRGPDAQTSFKFNNLNLVHTRLSILDLKHGHQPLIIGDHVIILNGEIYNHLELRDDLKNHSFKTQSDTETFLALYIKFGMPALEMCDGMFSFAILDRKSNYLTLGRDRAGKKPLYYYKKADQMFFASELNTIKQCIRSIESNEKEIYSYIRNGFFFPGVTPYKDVYEVKPGHAYTINLNDLSIKKQSYFNIIDFYRNEKVNNYNDALFLVDQALDRSVKNRMLSSDLEVGAFLSGGIDSSLIVSSASKYTTKLKTFTVRFDGLFDESKLARLTSKKFNTDHLEIDIPINLKEDIESILCNYGEPFMDSSAIPSYYVSKAAKKHVGVILNGDGADELFGGYRRYVPIANNWIVIAKYLSKFVKVLPIPIQKQSKYNYIYRLLKLSNKKGLDFYNSSTNDIFEDVYSFDDNDTFNRMNRFINNLENEEISSLSKILLMDFNLLLPGDLLKKIDIATMAHSLEGRSPFLSKYMLELAPTLNDKFKVKGLNTKVILRDLGKKYLPKELINQPKRGFEVPLKKWVNDDLKENILDSLNGDCFSASFISKSFINQLIDNKHNTSPEKRAKMLWTLYCLEIWKKNQI